MTGKRIGRKTYTITLSRKELDIIAECVGAMGERLEGIYIVSDKMNYLYDLCKELHKIRDQIREVDWYD